jgi:hypothetical protein
MVISSGAVLAIALREGGKKGDAQYLMPCYNPPHILHSITQLVDSTRFTVYSAENRQV